MVGGRTRPTDAGPSARFATDHLAIPLAIGAGAIGVIAFGLAWSTLLPGLGFWDTGEGLPHSRRARIILRSAAF